MAPTISRFDVASATFKAARRGPSIAAVRTGTRVTYRLSEPARTVFSVTRLAPGRLEGRRCNAPNKRNRRARTCTRRVAMRGSFVHRGIAGTNAFRFTGRLDSRALAPGDYLLSAIAYDPAGNRSSPVKHPFTIVR
jgi:hypothetical protein